MVIHAISCFLSIHLLQAGYFALKPDHRVSNILEMLLKIGVLNCHKAEENSKKVIQKILSFDYLHFIIVL